MALRCEGGSGCCRSSLRLGSSIVFVDVAAVGSLFWAAPTHAHSSPYRSLAQRTSWPCCLAGAHGGCAARRADEGAVQDAAEAARRAQGGGRAQAFHAFGGARRAAAAPLVARAARLPSLRAS
eukprot:1030209-Pleurochrysis_carterae.AAC.1